ncbi:MAG: Gfo/Idh/MocA family oxidoreductase [Pirellulaceae bacterium]
MQLRVGVIGLGNDWESRHRPALHTLQDRFKVEFIYDEVGFRARDAANQLGARRVQGFRQAIHSDQIDAIFFLGGQWTGMLPLQAACEAGKAIYLNTTFELGFAQQSEISRLVKASGVPFMVEFPRRVAPATTRLKELIATELGPPKLIFCHHRLALPKGQSGQGQPGYWAVRKVIAEIFDWCRYVVDGTPTSLFSVRYPHSRDATAHQTLSPGLTRGDSEQGDSEEADRGNALEDGSPEEGALDYQMLSIDFKARNGTQQRVVAQISAGTYLKTEWPEAASFRPPAAMQVCCENGVAFIDLPNTLIWFSPAGRHMESLEGERPVGERLLAMFYREAQNKTQGETSLTEFQEITRVIQAADESIDQSSRVGLNGNTKSPLD